jgi:Holliday junction resolvase RusA-like endonuclease
MLYVIPGDPVPLQRARVNPHSKRPWDPQKRIKYQIAQLISAQDPLKILYEGPLELKITFYMRRPKSAKRSEIFHSNRPDISNLLKFIEDVAQGILYKDDCTISRVVMEKIYGSPPRTEFTIRELRYG